MSLYASAESIGTLASARPWVARLASTLAAPFKALARGARIRRTERLLMELDDRTLADIGLRRPQVMSIAALSVDRPYLDPRQASM